jgi:hypothetical protein
MSLTAAIKEAYASCPPDVAILDTIDIWHPTWTDPIRLVRDRVALVATLESTSDLNPSTAVTFSPFPFSLTLPRTGEGPQGLTLTIDNATNLLMPILEAQDFSDGIPVRVIYRPYLSSDLSGPHWNPPLRLNVTGISATATQISVECGYLEFANRRFPRYRYTTDRFPGIAPRV